DNYATHKTPAVRKWLLRHPRFELHFIPTSSSWLNLVERWFAEVEGRVLRRGVHRSVADLVTDIRSWITSWNENPRPYVWVRTAEEILDRLAGYLTAVNDAKQ
ncbi:MAG: IS630 family transposase, partial [Alphaproteobacteria bacterium]